ncbi:hypothetical protein BJY16_006634 [Actinoplanes octamycinicus]|uniref:Uncharacterized protein n=1 Tax=Actinoplanes octamycinicus TaxID=135948 RepID=A0A7W7MAU0_9ACTN|nr:DUF6228 family protein [Actinoplanes octamycinicus]MBB4743175.1 hypothetical protein [Actinoplanes octamycinicus]GIE61263.1 hypothetical protein Aoc01nite_66650 [Actinoplanes octamycinicus]
MEQPFVLGAPDGERWVVHPLKDPYGDGYVLTAETELHQDGMTARTVARIDGQFANPPGTLPGFVAGLAADWRGWDGVRTWESWERELALDARHDGRGRVSLGVTLRERVPAGAYEGWSARAVFVLEAGEEMTRFAADLSHWAVDRRG